MLAHNTHSLTIKQEPKQMPDLIDDGTWRGAALARMSEVFFESQPGRGWRADRLPEEQIPANTVRWMLDDRYGEAVKLFKKKRPLQDGPERGQRWFARVKLDKSGKS